MDFWDRNKLKTIPQYDLATGADTGARGNTASCAVGHGWSPSSRYFMVSTTTPRMNVDNGVRLYKYNGTEVTEDSSLVSWKNEDFRPDQLLAAEFVPAAEGAYMPALSCATTRLRRCCIWLQSVQFAWPTWGGGIWRTNLTSWSADL